MSFEEILKAEYGEERVTIDYSKQSIDNTVRIRILSKNGKKEFKAEGVFLIDECVEIGGRKYNVQDFILALNTSFNKKD